MDYDDERERMTQEEWLESRRSLELYLDAVEERFYAEAGEKLFGVRKIKSNAHKPIV